MSKKNKITRKIKLFAIAISIFIVNIFFYSLIFAANKYTSTENIAVPLAGVGALVLLFLNGYLVLLVNKMTGERVAGDEKLEARITQAEKEIEHHKNIIDDHYNRLKDIETMLAVMKVQYDTLIEQHKKNHGG
jgi:hypothetical protein